MQKLKRKPWLQPLADTLLSLLSPARGLLATLPPFGRPAAIALTVITVLLLVMCCGCAPRTVRPSLPPQADARPMPAYDGQTFRDAVLYLIEVREWGLACEADKHVIREVYGHD